MLSFIQYMRQGAVILNMELSAVEEIHYIFLSSFFCLHSTYNHTEFAVLEFGLLNTSTDT